MKKVALTGNMGTGKSYISRCLQQQGVFVLDMDVCAKEVRTQHIDTISSLFSLSDATQIASIIFQDDAKRKQLEDFLYPLMIEKMQAFFQSHEKENIVVVEVPLLFEKGWETYFDEVWCVASNEEVALQRLVDYRQISKEEAKRRWAKQSPIEEKKQRSDYVIDNNEKDDVHHQIQQLLKKEGYVC